MKKKTVKKLKLKEGVKTSLLVIILTSILCVVMFAYCDRVENIQNNPNGYTENGHAHSIQVNFNR